MAETRELRERVRLELGEHVAEVVLIRGGKHNGLDPEMFAAINEAIDLLGDLRSLRAVVLRGEGPSFCAGLDFAAVIAAGGDIASSFRRRDGEIANDFQRVAHGWQALPVPVIAALHGNCLGGGAQIALGADLRIAADDLRFSVMEIKWGLIPDMGLSQSLPRLVRADVAKELTFTGRIVGAEEAERLGLITRRAADPPVAARELAAEIATKSPDAVRRAKLLLERAPGVPPADGLALEEELQRELLGSPNQLAAVQAGLSGDPARFSDPAE
jgi:enoyl-CoA hydratase/carnithine racemase